MRIEVGRGSRAVILAGALALLAAVFAMSFQVSGPGSAEAQEGEPRSYELFFRWTDVPWLSGNGVDIMESLEANTSPDGDLTSRVTAFYSWDGANQSWDAFFPSGIGIPGANDFSSLTMGTVYWVAINDGPSVTWTP